MRKQQLKKQLSKKLFGIQKKLFIYVMLLMSLILVLITIGVSSVVGRNVKKSLIEQYSYVNDKFFNGFESLYEQLNVISENCITNEAVQNSLKNRKLSTYEKEILTSSLRYLGDAYTDYSVYIDNKNNIYSLHNLDINFTDFYGSNMYKGMGKDYSKLKLFWERDFVSGTMEMGLFAGRYVHQLDKNYRPGIFYIKLQNTAFETMLKEMEDKESIFFILDKKGQTCYQKTFADNGQEETLSKIRQEISNIAEKENKISETKYTVQEKLGVTLGKKHEQTGFTIVTFIPDHVINYVLREIMTIILIISCTGFILAFLLVQYFAKQFTKPIRYISNLMENFDDLEFAQKAILHTNTELDYIGNSYNKLLEKIGILAGEVRFKEREVRKAELDTLLYQIHPHFLYNTLDTIYMLARISKEQTIMKMIQALSKYLRIILSNGAERITIREELDHVKAYLDIQRIRNSELFSYEITCDESVKEKSVIKMIMQPLVENSIKHGFQELEEDGIIRISIKDLEDSIVFSVQNNGRRMDEKTKNRLNRLETTDIEGINQVVTKERGGYGISNVVKRIRLNYQEQIRFYYVVSAQYTTCIIKIKKEMMENIEEK